MKYVDPRDPSREITKEEWQEYHHREGKRIRERDARSPKKPKRPRNINNQPLTVISYGIRKEIIKDGGSTYVDPEDGQQLKSAKKSIIYQGDQKTVPAELWGSRAVLCTLEPGWYSIQQHTNKLALGKNIVVERIKIVVRGAYKSAYIYGRGQSKRDWVLKTKLVVSTL